MIDYSYILLPSIIIYSVAYVTNVFCQSFEDNENNENPYQPPKYIFQIVWPILLFIYGLSWNQNRDKNGYLNLLIILSTWMILYLCLKMKELSFVLLLFSVFKCYQLISQTKDKSLYLLCGWLTFASFLNFQSI